MIMYDHFKCETCGESYKGKFRLTNSGKVECFDCENKEYTNPIKWEVIENETDIDDRLMRETFESMLIEDLGVIYMAEAEYGENYGTQFIDENGQANINKLYFYLNPVDLVIEGQKIAYGALRYLEGNSKKYRDHAKRLVDVYKGFREKKLTEEEIGNTWELFFSEETMELLEYGYE